MFSKMNLSGDHSLGGAGLAAPVARAVPRAVPAAALVAPLSDAGAGAGLGDEEGAAAHVADEALRVDAPGGEDLWGANPSGEIF